MATKIQKLKWDLHQKKHRFLLLYGLSHGLIFPYDDELIERLRKVSYGGIPASVILLSNAMTNGHCYDRALLMSQAFLDDSDDVKLLYGDIDSLKLNPNFIRDSKRYADHCFVERVTKLRHINDKESIRRFIEEDEDKEDIERDKYASPLILPMIETTFGQPTEMYSLSGIDLLQREIEHFKKTINYDEVLREIDEDMKRLGIRK